ncbi:MAG TPA: hypothetical protein ENH99_01495 [Candidatus Pacearchaeota archaeon]|nr:hypothetical protein [Candidatus Pacearchaeota archaeon]
MDKNKEKEKTIYNLELHETLILLIDEKDPATEKEIEKRIEITRVPGGWVYAFDYPFFRQTSVVFVPFNNQYMKK